MCKEVVSMESIWSRTVKFPQFEQLNGDYHTDVLVIGGGIAGLLCGYMLNNSGINCAIIEADKICNGVTQNTTAKITVQHGLLYHKLISKYSLEKAQLYFQAQNRALEMYRALSNTIDCDFEESDAFVYSRNSRIEIESEANALRKIGCPAVFAEDVHLPFRIKGAVCVPKQAQFHPLKFLNAIAKDLPIFEDTRALEVKPGEVITNNGRIKAEKIIVATHFPFLNKYGLYFMKLYQHRSYVLALKDAPDVKGMYVDASLKGLSFRNANGLLLLGGGGHRTGKKGGNWIELSEFARTHYPGAQEVARWAAQDCMSLDGIPYIGQYSKMTPNVYVATGFNKWGMTNAMVSAMVLTDLITGKENAYSQVFSPSRRILHPQLAVNLAESLIGLLTPTVPRCPHLGCALKYNRYEHSWDCPCHGSRFTEDGKVIDNPANGDKITGG